MVSGCYVPFVTLFLLLLPRSRRADCHCDQYEHGFGPLSSICESPPVALPATSLEITHTPRGVQTTLQKLRASVSTVVHRIKEDFKLVGRLAITWSCVCTIFLFVLCIDYMTHLLFFNCVCVCPIDCVTTHFLFAHCSCRQMRETCPKDCIPLVHPNTAVSSTVMMH